MVTLRPERPDLRGEEGVWPSARAGDLWGPLGPETLKGSSFFFSRSEKICALRLERCLRPCFYPKPTQKGRQKLTVKKCKGDSFGN